MKNGLLLKKVFIFLLASMVLLTGIIGVSFNPVFAEENETVLLEEAAVENTANDVVEEAELSEEGQNNTEAQEVQMEEADPAGMTQNSEETLTAMLETTSAELGQEIELLEEEKEEEVETAEEETEEETEESKDHPVYGTFTGKEGTGSDSGNVIFKEYEKDGVYTLVYSVLDSTLSPEECAINVPMRGTEFASRTGRIVLEEGVTGIGWKYLWDRSNYVPQYPSDYPINRNKTDLFKNFSSLTELVLCESLQRIGWSAFNGCKKLTTVDFTVCKNLEEIMNQAFYNCSSLNYVDLSDCGRLLLVAWCAFSGAGKGKDAMAVLSPEELTVIGGRAFESWKNVIHVEPKEDENKTLTLRYQVNAGPSWNGSALYGSLPELNGEAQVEGLKKNDTAVAPALTDLYHTQLRGTVYDHFPFFTYMFRGWKMEDGTLVKAGETFTPVDKNRDGFADVTADWSYQWKEKSGSTGTPSANFCIWTNVSSANSQIDQDVMLAEAVTNYSPKVGSALIYALDGNGETVYPEEILSPAAGGTNKDKFMMITYLGSTILQADKEVRELAYNGYTTSDPRNGEVTWKLSYFPEDEEVLANLAEFVRQGKTVLKDEKGHVIPAEDLTTDNFVVRWCHVKYQSGSNDGWNINGKLTRKVNYASVTKTFTGDPDAIEAAIKQGFNITLTNTEDANDVITLNMTDRTKNVINEGTIHASQTGNGSFGYIKREGNKFTWIIMTDKEKQFSVAEHNYNVTIGDVSYGVSVQYNQTNTGDEQDSYRRQWTNETLVVTETHPQDNIDFNAMETTNFYNEYIPKGTFYIEKFDNRGVVLENVTFSIYENGRLLKLYKPAESVDGSEYYNVLYEDGSSQDAVKTRADGRLVLHLPVREDGTYVYTIVESIPEGFEGAGKTAQFNVAVSPDGSYEICDTQIDQAYGSVSSLSSGGSVWGAKVINNRIPKNPPAPTDVTFPVTPFLILFGAGLGLAALLILKRKGRKED